MSSYRISVTPDHLVGGSTRRPSSWRWASLPLAPLLAGGLLSPLGGAQASWCGCAGGLEINSDDGRAIRSVPKPAEWPTWAPAGPGAPRAAGLAGGGLAAQSPEGDERTSPRFDLRRRLMSLLGRGRQGHSGLSGKDPYPQARSPRARLTSSPQQGRSGISLLPVTPARRTRSMRIPVRPTAVSPSTPRLPAHSSTAGPPRRAPAQAASVITVTTVSDNTLGRRLLLPARGRRQRQRRCRHPSRLRRRQRRRHHPLRWRRGGHDRGRSDSRRSESI